MPGGFEGGEEIPLAGGSMTAVVRVGDTIRRPTGRWTPAVHSLLRYLEDVGFEGAPHVLGFDDKGREVLTYLPSEPTARWSDEVLIGAAHLVRRFHDALDDSCLHPAPGGSSARPEPQREAGGDPGAGARSVDTGTVAATVATVVGANDLSPPATTHRHLHGRHDPGDVLCNDTTAVTDAGQSVTLTVSCTDADLDHLMYSVDTRSAMG